MKLIGSLFGLVLSAALPKMGTIIEQATADVARREDTALSPAAAPEVAKEIAARLPADPKALVPLWPQIMRIGIMALGWAAAGYGYGQVDDWRELADRTYELAPIASAALGPPAYLIWATLRARKPAKAL